MAGQTAPSAGQLRPAAGCPIEERVASIAAYRACENTAPHPRPNPHRRRADRRMNRDFGALLELLGPCIQRLIRAYGLGDMMEDAVQVCAIAVHRAIDRYDPAKARFTTFATWQMRGELQSLRHRVRLDSRQSARSAGVRTVSLDAPPESSCGAWIIVEHTAQHRAEAGANGWMTRRVFDRIWDDYRVRAKETQSAEKLAEERALFDAALFGAPEPAGPRFRSAEQRRQARRRVTRHLQRNAITTHITNYEEFAAAAPTR